MNEPVADHVPICRLRLDDRASIPDDDHARGSTDICAGRAIIRADAPVVSLLPVDGEQLTTRSNDHDSGKFQRGSPRPCCDGTSRSRTAITIPTRARAHKPPPLAVLQLDAGARRDREVPRRATPRSRRAIVDIGLFVPNMGWHYMKESWSTSVRSDQARAAGVRRRSLRRQAQAGRGGIRRAAGAVEEGAGRIRRAGPMSGTRTRSSSCGRCTPGSSSSIRTACSRRSIRAY